MSSNTTWLHLLPKNAKGIKETWGPSFSLLGILLLVAVVACGGDSNVEPLNENMGPTPTSGGLMPLGNSFAEPGRTVARPETLSTKAIALPDLQEHELDTTQESGHHSRPFRQVSPDVPRDVSGYSLFSPYLRGLALSAGPETDVETLLEKGLLSSGGSPVHIVVMGSPKLSSTRCVWRGVARTTDQRELAIRVWLSLGDGDSLPSPTQVESQFMGILSGLDLAFPQTAKANF